VQPSTITTKKCAYLTNNQNRFPGYANIFMLELYFNYHFSNQFTIKVGNNIFVRTYILPHFAMFRRHCAQLASN